MWLSFLTIVSWQEVWQVRLSKMKPTSLPSWMTASMQLWIEKKWIVKESDSTFKRSGFIYAIIRTEVQYRNQKLIFQLSRTPKSRMDQLEFQEFRVCSRSLGSDGVLLWIASEKTTQIGFQDLNITARTVNVVLFTMWYFSALEKSCLMSELVHRRATFPV